MGTPSARKGAVAVAPNGTRNDRELIAGFAVGLLAAIVMLVIVLLLLGYVSLPTSTLPNYPPDAAEPRATAAWPFRSEWLTPNPRG